MQRKSPRISGKHPCPLTEMEAGHQITKYHLSDEQLFLRYLQHGRLSPNFRLFNESRFHFEFCCPLLLFFNTLDEKRTNLALNSLYFQYHNKYSL